MRQPAVRGTSLKDFLCLKRRIRGFFLFILCREAVFLRARGQKWCGETGFRGLEMLEITAEWV